MHSTGFGLQGSGIYRSELLPCEVLFWVLRRIKAHEQHGPGTMMLNQQVLMQASTKRSLLRLRQAKAAVLLNFATNFV